jgi:protocatechuate 4,5-dioxygenase beta chain
MWHVMRGALEENASEVYRHYHVPASNTAAALMILDNRSAA